MAATQSFLVVGVVEMSWKRGSLQNGLMVATFPYRRRLVKTTQAYPPETTGFNVGSGLSVESAPWALPPVGAYPLPLALWRRVAVFVLTSSHHSSPWAPTLEQEPVASHEERVP